MNILWITLKTLGSLFVVACALRAYLQAVRLHAQNPLSRLTFQMTDWIVLPMRRLVPGFGGVDWASILSVLLLSVLMATVYYFLMFWSPLGEGAALSKPVRPFGWLVALAVIWAIEWSLQLAMVVLIVGVMMSWLAPLHPLKPVFDLLSAPMLAPFRRLLGGQQRGFGSVRPRGGFDLSPIGAFLLLQIFGALIATLEAGVMSHLF
ncbi:MAG: YggT family protein [Burkholderiaceae bacterium]|nr:YggT family protein [Burkholderiaceae bacterium]